MQKKTTDRRSNMHKTGASEAELSDGDTPTPSISSEFIVYRVKTRWRGSSQERGLDIVLLRNSRSL
jgi:hypothetical protein